MIMTVWQSIVTIAMVVLGTLLTRFLPFILFPDSRKPPRTVEYLGRMLPHAMTGLLVVYALKDTSPFSGSHGVPETLAVLVIMALHHWKHSMLLSIAGGTGPESTIVYYKEITSGVRKRLGHDAFPHLCIESLDVFEVLGFCNHGDYDDLASYLAAGVGNPAAAGADFAAFTGITPHIVFDEVVRRSPIPIVSMLETSRDYAIGRHYGRIALLGTGPTMDGDFFQRPFRKCDITVVTPNDDEKRYIAGVIETELEYGIVKPETQEMLKTVTERLVRREHAEAVVLGCTELPLAFDGIVLPVNAMDVMRIHIDALIDRIVGD